MSKSRIADLVGHCWQMMFYRLRIILAEAEFECRQAIMHPHVIHSWPLLLSYT